MTGQDSRPSIPAPEIPVNLVQQAEVIASNLGDENNPNLVQAPPYLTCHQFDFMHCTVHQCLHYLNCSYTIVHEPFVALYQAQRKLRAAAVESEEPPRAETKEEKADRKREEKEEKKRERARSKPGPKPKNKPEPKKKGPKGKARAPLDGLEDQDYDRDLSDEDAEIRNEGDLEQFQEDQHQHEKKQESQGSQ